MTPPTEPDLWVLVPREPVPEMVAAWWRQKNTGSQEPGQHDPTKTSDYDAYRALIEASPPAPVEDDAVGCAEREVGRFFYNRISALMDAELGTGDAIELAYLAQIVSDVEEYGADGTEVRDSPWQAGEAQRSPAPVEPMRKPLSDEDVERAARAFDAAVAERQGDHDAWVIYETWVASAKGDTERASALAKLADLRAERMDAMRSALSVLPPVAGGGETPERNFESMERALLMAGAHCQGGHSDAGMLIAENFGIPFPLTMPNLRSAAEARGYTAAELWPWWVKQRPDLFNGTPTDPGADQ